MKEIDKDKIKKYYGSRNVEVYTKEDDYFKGYKAGYEAGIVHVTQLIESELEFIMTKNMECIIKHK